MEGGSIPDSNITASSELNANTPAKNGRLNFASGSSWCAATSDTNSYLQIDLQTLHIICAVSTQGNSQADKWVTNYTLQSSTDGSTWKYYTEIGQVKVHITCHIYVLYVLVSHSFPSWLHQTTGTFHFPLSTKNSGNFGTRANGTKNSWESFQKICKVLTFRNANHSSQHHPLMECALHVFKYAHQVTGMFY